MLESRSSLSGATLIDQRVAQVKLLIVAIESFRETKCWNLSEVTRWKADITMISFG